MLNLGRFPSSIGTLNKLFVGSSGRSNMFVGQIDSYDEHVARGWAMARGGGDRLIVAAAHDASLAQRADRHRADVQQAFPGHDGYCGFAIRVPAIDHLRLVESVTGWALPGPAVRRRTPRIRVKDDLRYVIDPWGTVVSGWIVRGANERCEVRLEIGGRHARRARACLFRPDAGLGSDGFHGFCLALPREHDEIRLVEAVSETILLTKRV